MLVGRTPCDAYLSWSSTAEPTIEVSGTETTHPICPCRVTKRRGRPSCHSAIAEAGTGAILKDLHELLLRLEERSNPATDTTHYGNSRISATSFYQHYARHIGAAVQDAFGVEMLRVEACLGQAWLKRQRVLRDPGLIDDPRPPPKRREPSA